MSTRAGWNGNLVFEDGTYYQVKFEWIPRAGEMISLTSFKDIADGADNSRHAGIVERVVHHMVDLDEGETHPEEDRHMVDVYVGRIAHHPIWGISHRSVSGA